MKKLILIFAVCIMAFPSCSTNTKQTNKFITVENGQFIRDGKPYYYIGANYWYGPILGSKGIEGNRKRLVQELDQMMHFGINNVRVLVGAEGPDGEPRRVTPALQVSPGVYNEDLLDGLDFLLYEMKKRDMVAILYLNNAWEWSGGFSQYLAWNGKGPIPYPETKGHTWSEFMSFSGTFLQCDECQQQFHEFIKHILGRTNAYSGVAYVDDPTIMTWELANEPRAFSNANKKLLVKWVNETSAYIKSLDHNHLVTTGTEGIWGCENDPKLFEDTHTSSNIDYLTMHIWPYNWRWLNPQNMTGTIDASLDKVRKYMDEHMAIARKLKKPLVFEEFGLPRDGFVFTPESPVTCRDKYYNFSFARVLESAKTNDVMAGANFWSYSGDGKPNPLRENHMWQVGDDYLGDPPQEAQGLNSVFAFDPTMDIVKKYNEELEKLTH
jgi:mannan endo-1,4-beta-mannosidase